MGFYDKLSKVLFKRSELKNTCLFILYITLVNSAVNVTMPRISETRKTQMASMTEWFLRSTINQDEGRGKKGDAVCNGDGTYNVRDDNACAMNAVLLASIAVSAIALYGVHKRKAVYLTPNLAYRFVELITAFIASIQLILASIVQPTLLWIAMVATSGLVVEVHYFAVYCMYYNQLIVEEKELKK